MRKTKDIVCYDFQGWPEYKMNLREILLALGGQQDGDFIKFPSDAPLMDIYPRILVDDGMGARTLLRRLSLVGRGLLVKPIYLSPLYSSLTTPFILVPFFYVANQIIGLSFNIV
jgi:hypothetical protein